MCKNNNKELKQNKQIKKDITEKVKKRVIIKKRAAAENSLSI